MTLAIIVGVLLGALWFIGQHWGGSKREIVPVRRPPTGAKRIHADDVPATWQGQPVSDAYRQHIIDTDEEIPF